MMRRAPTDTNNANALRDEAYQVWLVYAAQTVWRTCDTAVITPSKVTNGGDIEGYPMYFARQPDGQWVFQK